VRNHSQQSSFLKHFCIIFIPFFLLIIGTASFFHYLFVREPHVTIPAFHRSMYGISFLLMLLAGYASFYIARLITRIKNAATSAWEKETRYRILYDSSFDGIAIANNEGVIIDSNQKIQDLFGYGKDELQKKYLFELLFEHINVQYRENAPFALLTQGKTVETEGIRKNGEIFPVEITIRSLKVYEQNYYACLARDISIRKHTEEKIRTLSHAVEQSPNSIIITDFRGTIEYVNAKFTGQTGYTKDEVLGKTPRLLKSGKMPEEIFKDLWETILSGKEWHGELVNKKKNNELYWERASISPVKNHDGIITHFIAIKEDCTERKNHEEQLVYLAEKDHLTGLINRRSFSGELEKRLADAHRYGTGGAVLFIDIDNFKSINDIHGHHVGDEFLITIALLLKERLRETDTAARLGGDEFAVILHHVNGEQARKISEEIHDRIRQYVRNDAMLTLLDIGASIGVALYPENAKTEEELLSNADFAMYKAKAEQKNTIRFFSCMEKYEKTTILNTKTQLKKALLNNSFSLFMQPIMNLEHNTITCFEILLRMINEDGSLLCPGSFIKTAESYGFINELDRWVIHNTLKFIHDHHSQTKGQTFEINLSGMAFSDAELLPLLKECIRRFSINPETLIFEITETAVIRSIIKAKYFIDSIRDLGCQFAFDDFCSGYSSFSYLKHFPVKYLKIDGSFIQNLPNSREDQHLVRSIVQLAGGFDKKTIAEYVECENTVALLREYGINYAQGYYIGRPMPATEVITSSIKKSASLEGY